MASISTGYGPIPAPIARELALGRAGSTAGRWIRRLFLDPHRCRLVDQDTIITVTPTGHRYDSPAPAPPGARPDHARADTERGSPVERKLRALLGRAA